MAKRSVCLTGMHPDHRSSPHIGGARNQDRPDSSCRRIVELPPHFQSRHKWTATDQVAGDLVGEQDFAETGKSPANEYSNIDRFAGLDLSKTTSMRGLIDNDTGTLKRSIVDNGLTLTLSSVGKDIDDQDASRELFEAVAGPRESTPIDSVRVDVSTVTNQLESLEIKMLERSMPGTN